VNENAVGCPATGVTETTEGGGGQPVVVIGNGAAVTAADRAWVARVEVIVVHSGAWRTNATGGLTAPVAASVTRPLRLSTTAFIEKSRPAPTYGGIGSAPVSAGRVSIARLGPVVALPGA
jgi:hypothetical protein